MGQMTASEVEQRLVREIASILNVEPATIDPAAALSELGLDSMSFIELLVFIEKAFSLRLIETELSQSDFRTIGALASRIARGSEA